MKVKKNISNNIAIPTKVMGFFLSFFLIKVFFLSAFFFSFSQITTAKSLTKTVEINENHIVSIHQFKKINIVIDHYSEVSELSEINDFDGMRSDLHLEKISKNNAKLPSIFTTNNQQIKLYIKFCCLRIHLV